VRTKAVTAAYSGDDIFARSEATITVKILPPKPFMVCLPKADDCVAKPHQSRSGGHLFRWSLTPVSGMVAMTVLMDRTKAIRLPAATSRSRGVTYRFQCVGNTKCRYQEAGTATLITVGTACLVRRNEPRRAPWVVSSPNG
jgi:hypothetical protein